jgi:hypothetical protein
MRRYQSRYQGRDLVALVAALVAPFMICLALVPFRDNFTATNMALVLVVVVVAIAAMGNRIAGALAALAAALWFDFYFTTPYQSFTIATRDGIETTVLLLAVGLAVSQLAARARRLQVFAITDAGYLSQIHETVAFAKSASTPRAVVDHVRPQLVDLLELRECHFEYGTLLGNPPRLERDGTVAVGRRSWDVDHIGLPDEDVELRTFRNGSYYGRFMLRGTQGKIPSLEARLVAVTLADQVGVVR